MRSKKKKSSVRKWLLKPFHSLQGSCIGVAAPCKPCCGPRRLRSNFSEGARQWHRRTWLHSTPSPAPKPADSLVPARLPVARILSSRMGAAPSDPDGLTRPARPVVSQTMIKPRRMRAKIDGIGLENGFRDGTVLAHQHGISDCMGVYGVGGQVLHAAREQGRTTVGPNPQTASQSSRQCPVCPARSTGQALGSQPVTHPHVRPLRRPRPTMSSGRGHGRFGCSLVDRWFG